MQIIMKPTAAIRQNYTMISKLCRDTGQPVFLTKNGEGDLVVMDIDAFFRREEQLELRERLLEIEERRRFGEKDVEMDMIRERLQNLTHEAERPAARSEGE